MEKQIWGRIIRESRTRRLTFYFMFCVCKRMQKRQLHRYDQNIKLKSIEEKFIEQLQKNSNHNSLLIVDYHPKYLMVRTTWPCLSSCLYILSSASILDDKKDGGECVCVCVWFMSLTFQDTWVDI